jgi:hypothetical protein
MNSHRLSGRAAAVILAVALVAAGCGTSSTTASPSAAPSTAASSLPSSSPSTADPSAVYAEIEGQVQQLRELQAKAPVVPTLLDDATLKKNMSASFAKDNPPELVAANQRLFELMGLVPPESSLADLYVKLLGSQVAGYYDPDAKQLFVVSKTGAVGPLEKFIFSHEYDHALQDQNFGLKNLALESVGQGDAALAHLSVAEGDATLIMTLWAQAHLTPAEMAGLVTASSDPEQLKILNEMPDILKETLLFPYLSGVQLVLQARTAGGWPAVNALYAKPPASTEQVLHPDKYAAGEAPIPVTFPKDLATRLGSGWTIAMDDTLGEFQLGVWLKSAGKVPQEAATTSAQGWGGDRVALVTNGARAGVVIDTRWDSPADATEFAAAAQTTLDAIGGHHASIAIDGTDRVTLFIATDDPTISVLASALGLAG